MNATKASPVSPGDRWMLGEDHSLRPRKDWLRGQGSGGSGTATLTLFCLGWLLYCAGAISYQGMIGLPGIPLDSAGCSEPIDLVFTGDRTVATPGTVHWPVPECASNPRSPGTASAAEPALLTVAGKGGGRCHGVVRVNSS